MSESSSGQFQSFPRRGKKAFNFLLGSGPLGTCGHVELELICTAEPVGSIAIDWLVPPDLVPDEVRSRIMVELERRLHGYIVRHPVGAIRVQVHNAGGMPERINEPERAVAVALHLAYEKAGLPVPMIFAPPDGEDSKE